MAKLLQDAAATRKRIRQATEEESKPAGILLNDIIDNKDGSNDESNKPKRVRNEKLKAKEEAVAAAAALVNANSSKIIYLGHIPDGFCEKEMKKYFAQYGKVLRVKLFRSPKTNRSKGYAFIEFEDYEVARTASESMQGYFMMERQLVSHVVPKEKIHDGMFKGPKQVKKPKKK
jgi:nucleolar protein 15